MRLQLPSTRGILHLLPSLHPDAEVVAAAHRLAVGRKDLLQSRHVSAHAQVKALHKMLTLLLTVVRLSR